MKHPFPRTFQHAWRNPGVRGSDLKVYAELHESLSIVEFRPVKPWHIAGMLHIDRSTVQRCITHLVQLGYLEQGNQSGNCFTFRLRLPGTISGPAPTDPGALAAA